VKALGVSPVGELYSACSVVMTIPFALVGLGWGSHCDSKSFLIHANNLLKVGDMLLELLNFVLEEGYFGGLTIILEVRDVCL